MNRNIGKNVSENLRGRYSQKLLDHAKQSATKAEATDDLTGNKITDKATNISKASQQSNSKTVTDEHGKEILEERYISPEERQENYWWSKINIII